MLLFDKPDSFNENNITAILQKASDYVQQVIQRSGSRLETPPNLIPFIDIEIENMRIEIDQAIKQQVGEENINLTAATYLSDPRVLAIKKEIIEKEKIGNCGEHVSLALAYLLENHKEEFNGLSISIMESGNSRGNMQHVYLRVYDKLNKIDLLFDPTNNEICKRNEKLGNIFIRGGRRGLANQYEPFKKIDSSHIENEITRLQLSEINYKPSLKVGKEV